MNARFIRLMLAGALGLAVASTSPVLAQTTLGGAKNQQNKIGGVAKPAPVVGGSAIRTPPPVIGTVKPMGTATPNATTNPLTQPPGPRPSPPVVAPKPASPVVTSNLKCANGACTSRGVKP